MDPYESFTERYDMAFGLFGEHDPQVVTFFHHLFLQNNVKTVLDCACGTGRHLPLFHSLGCEVSGSDISESMLAKARINLAEKGLEIPLYHADFRDLPSHFRRPFDAVVCLAAIGFMTGEMEFLRAFESMRQVICAGGILILTAIPTDRQWKEKPRYALVTNTPGFSRIFAIDYLETKACYNILDVFHTTRRSDIKVWSTELHLLLRDDQERVLKKAGFCTVDFYGSFGFSTYDKETSNSLITVAYK